jgi:hypothetical protein
MLTDESTWLWITNHSVIFPVSASDSFNGTLFFVRDLSLVA